MKTQLLAALALLVASFTTAPVAQACGGVNESSRMCVAVPEAVSTFLLDDDAMEMINDEGNIEFLSAAEAVVTVGTTKKRGVRGTVTGKTVSGVGLYRTHDLLSGWFVRIGEYPGLVKLLTSLQFRGLIPKLRAENARLTSLYAMSDGSGLIRVNGTEAGAYSIVGVLSPTGELSGLEIRR